MAHSGESHFELLGSPGGGVAREGCHFVKPRGRLLGAGTGWTVGLSPKI